MSGSPSAQASRAIVPQVRGLPRRMPGMSAIDDTQIEPRAGQVRVVLGGDVARQKKNRVARAGRPS